MSMVVVHVASSARNILVFLGRMAEDMGHALHSTTTYVRGEVIDVEYIPTEEIATDYLTKLLKRQKSRASPRMVGLYEDTSRGGNKQTQPHAEWECCELAAVRLLHVSSYRFS
jgi:hypothetical protein